MSLKHLPLGRCGQNMKAISYMYMQNPLGWCGRNMKAISCIHVLQQSCTFFKTLTQL